MSGVTDRLLELTASAERRRDAHVLNGVAELSRRHFEAIERLLPADTANDVLVEIGAQLDDLRALLKATGDPSGRRRRAPTMRSSAPVN